MPASIAFIVVAAATIAAAQPAQSPDPLHAARADLSAAHATLRDDYQLIQKRSGIAADLQERLDADTPGPGTSSKPAWMSESDFVLLETTDARLEKSLIDQYASGRYHALASVRGADDTVFVSPVDHTLHPLAAYVPHSYDPKRATSLVVFLPGRTCTENDPISLPWLQTAADSTGSIVVAPYARGDSQYVDPAPADVYASLTVAEKAFNVDPNRVYLAGHSMGGYGVFIVQPRQPQTWAGVLAASGGMTTETLHASLEGLQGVPVYLVVGSDDPIVPSGYMRQNNDLLSKSEIETHYYEQPGGLHAIGSIARAFAQAWHDMLSRPRARSPQPAPSLVSTPATPQVGPTTRP